MLRNLQIRDLAIIDAVEIDFAAGLTVLTGETGAGKSMLVDAIELLSGGRAGAEVVRAGAERADLSASVDISKVGGELRHVLEEQSIAHEGELLLRRVIASDGRSRAWINGQSVPVTVLRAVGELLFDIHGQHEFQSLMRNNAQRELLDTFGQLEALVGQVRGSHASWLALMNRSVTVEAAASERHARLDLLRYQVQELDALRLGADEFTRLSVERTRIANSGKLAEAARGALEGSVRVRAGQRPSAAGARRRGVAHRQRTRRAARRAPPAARGSRGASAGGGARPVALPGVAGIRSDAPGHGRAAAGRHRGTGAQAPGGARRAGRLARRAATRTGQHGNRRSRPGVAPHAGGRGAGGLPGTGAQTHGGALERGPRASARR